MKKPVRKLNVDTIELRRWCIEQATRWPVVTVHPHAGIGQAVYGNPAGGQVDCDVIARAEKLWQWVTK